VYVRQIKGKWKVVGVPSGGSASYGYGPVCTTRSAWLRDRGGRKWSSMFRIPAGSILWGDVSTSADSRLKVSYSDASGTWAGWVDSRRVGAIKLPGNVTDAAAACKEELLR
jgi:hypothetical protein